MPWLWSLIGMSDFGKHSRRGSERMKVELVYERGCPNIQQTDIFHNLFKIYCKWECISFQNSLKHKCKSMFQWTIHTSIKLKIEHDCIINAGHPNTITIKCFLLFASSSKTLCSIYNIFFYCIEYMLNIEYWFQRLFMFILVDLMWFDSWLKFCLFQIIKLFICSFRNLIMKIVYKDIKSINK